MFIEALPVDSTVVIVYIVIISRTVREDEQLRPHVDILIVTVAICLINVFVY